MSSFSFRIARPVPVTRSIAVAALLGATMLAGPLSVARAAPAINVPIQLAQAVVPAAVAPPAVTPLTPSAAATKAESVEERISSLHTALNITPNEESDWNGVAKAMRDNAAAMQKLAADKHAQAPDSVTAVDDLKTYEKFARAHVAGLKTLTSSFEKLYASMPDPQKKVADQVFLNFGHHAGGAAHS
jgi:periplasmic protein CpxP/Spy